MNRIEALQARIGFATRDGLGETYAAANLEKGLPAFGWIGSYSNQPAGTVANVANRLASIQDAQDELREFFTMNARDVDAAEWLDNLLPLNRPAELDLMVAYQRIGIMVTADELRARTIEREFA